MRIGVSGIGRRRRRKGQRTHEKPRGGQTPRADSNGAFFAQLFSLTHTVTCLKRGREDIDFMKVTHPRSIATFPCVLRRAVREEKRISLAEAIRKLTGMPAEVYGLAGKGRIQTGMDADLTLFDAAKITDHATYTQPLLPNEGIRRVYVGGVCAVRDDQYTGAMAGKLLRRSR